MEGVEINIPNTAATQSGVYSFDSEDHISLFALFVYNASNLIKRYDFDCFDHNTSFLHSGYESIFAENNSSSFVTYLGKKSYSYSLVHQYFDKMSGVFSSIKFNKATDKQKEISNRIDILTKAFDAEIKKFGFYILADNTIAIYLFKKIATEAAKINFTDSSVELTPTNSFKIKLLLPDNKLLVITKPFGEVDDLGPEEVIFGIFQGKRCLISDAKNIVDLVKGINEYLDSK